MAKAFYSRIVTLTAIDDSVKVQFTGSNQQPFYTDIMGKHQWLPDENLLITEARGGRVLCSFIDVRTKS